MTTESASITVTETDRIERSIQIDAPRSRVWRALANAEEFGNWFGANLKGQAFAPGQRVQGPITIAGYEHVVFDVVIERIEALSNSCPTGGTRMRWTPPSITRRSSARWSPSR